MNLNYLRTSESVALPEKNKKMYKPCKRSAFLQILHIFCSPLFPWVFHTRCIAEHSIWYQNKTLDLLKEFEGTEQESGDKGIKKNNLKKNKHHERLDEIIEIGKKLKTKGPG